MPPCGRSWTKFLRETIYFRFLFAIIASGKRKRETAGGSIAFGLSRAAGRYIGRDGSRTTLSVS